LPYTWPSQKSKGGGKRDPNTHHQGGKRSPGELPEKGKRSKRTPYEKRILRKKGIGLDIWDKKKTFKDREHGEKSTGYLRLLYGEGHVEKP